MARTFELQACHVSQQRVVPVLKQVQIPESPHTDSVRGDALTPTGDRGIYSRTASGRIRSKPRVPAAQQTASQGDTTAKDRKMDWDRVGRDARAASHGTEPA